MISKLREVSADTMLAQGPKFNLDKVLAAGSSILRILIGRSQMRFPDADPVCITGEQPEQIPETAESLEQIEAIFREIKEKRFDAAGLHFYLEFGPYIAAWSPLGFDALYGKVSNCLTSADANWEDYDPTPMLYLVDRKKPFFKMGRKATAFLVEMLAAECLRGTDAYFVDSDTDAWMLVIRFPYEAFGDGYGRIRILREDFSERKASDEDEEAGA